MADLQGPKIRIGKFAAGPVQIKAGQEFILDAACTLGDEGALASTIRTWSMTCAAGDVLLLDDGRTVFDVLQVQGKEIRCRNRHDGELSNNKGINKQGGGLTAPALTAKDMEDIRTAASLGIDYVAVSFPKSGDDMRLARALLNAAGSKACWWPRSSASKPSRTSTTSSKPPTASWWRAATWRSKSATRRCRRCRNASSAPRASSTSSPSPRRR
jgi:pyruvate kinase